MVRMGFARFRVYVPVSRFLSLAECLNLMTICPRRLLLLGYRQGFQVWDCTNLGTISEVVNVTSSEEWGAVTYAALLPTPRQELETVKAPQRPYLGVV